MKFSDDAYGAGPLAATTTTTSTATGTTTTITTTTSTGTATTTSFEDPWTKRDPAFLPGYGIAGDLSEYNAKRFFSWLDIRRPEKGVERAEMLRSASWIDSSSSKLEVLIILYNAEIQAYGHINIQLILKRGGLIMVDMKVRTLWASMYPHWTYYVVDGLWVLCILKFIANSVQKVVDNRGIGGCRRRCCGLPPEEGGGWWLGLDWLGIFMAICILVMIPILLMGFGELNKKVGGLVDPLSDNTTDYDNITTNFWEPVGSMGTFYSTNAEIIEEIEAMVFMKMVHRHCMYWYAMVFLLRWFRGFRGQAKMAQITQTLSSALADLLHFALIAMVLFVNFALAGYVLFGSEAEDFSTVTKSLQSGLSMTWGQIDYDKLYAVAPLSSMIWLAGYVLSMVMISMNMLLAIIATHYGDIFHANRAGDRGFDIFGQAKAMIWEFWWSTSYVGRGFYRLVATKLPDRVVKSRAMPRYGAEEDRRDIPYDDLYLICDLDPIGFMTEKGLREAGCDRATAKHLFVKCQDEVSRHHDETYPLELLFDEFDESMRQYYFAMDAFTNDLRNWFKEKSSSTKNVFDRQNKLDQLAEKIEPAQHIEHKHHHHHSAGTMEGEGHHHHHHRQHHHGTSEGSHSQSNSRMASHSTANPNSRRPTHDNPSRSHTHDRPSRAPTHDRPARSHTHERAPTNEPPKRKH